ncbi:hypothetical protein R3P38DRAFT_2810157 [Favolaschia claudopus]|uniref:Uncharacterized protein n=1 Tax=Favolaschia claudopus TaxID=2862362 RepID=A0AAV9ZCP6_9AGAR
MSLRKDVRNISDRESAFRFNSRQFSSLIEVSRVLERARRDAAFVVIKPPGRWSKGERRRRAFMRRFSRMTPMQRLRILCDINLFRDYKGFIYAFEQRVFDRSGAYIGTRVKYGLTNKMERRRREYGKCGEATIHARLRARGIHIKKVYCVCGGRHREFFWKFGIGGDVDIKLEVEQTLIDTAQPINRHLSVEKSRHWDFVFQAVIAISSLHFFYLSRVSKERPVISQFSSKHAGRDVAGCWLLAVLMPRAWIQRELEMGTSSNNQARNTQNDDIQATSSRPPA